MFGWSFLVFKINIFIKVNYVKHMNFPINPTLFSKLLVLNQINLVSIYLFCNKFGIFNISFVNKDFLPEGSKKFSAF